MIKRTCISLIGLALSLTTVGTTPGHAASACRPGDGGAAVLVVVSGLKDAAGNVRLQLYGDRPDEFLEKGTKLRRVEVPAAPGGALRLCVELPGPGTYALAALHDRNGNGKLDILGDGSGFSGNPVLTLAKPKYRDVAFEARSGVKQLEIVMNYRQGLGVRPINRR